MIKKTSVTFKCDEPFVRALKLRAKHYGMSQSKLLRSLVWMDAGNLGKNYLINYVGE